MAPHLETFADTLTDEGVRLAGCQAPRSEGQFGTFQPEKAAGSGKRATAPTIMSITS
jgi:hypothetical protein